MGLCWKLTCKRVLDNRGWAKVFLNFMRLGHILLACGEGAWLSGRPSKDATVMVLS